MTSADSFWSNREYLMTGNTTQLKVQKDTEPSSAQSSEVKVSDLIFNRLVSGLTLSEKKQFTPEQLEILRGACSNLVSNPKKHKVNIKLSVPVPLTSGFYLSILAGPEQRSKSRIVGEQRNFWIILALLFGMATMTGTTLIDVKPVQPKSEQLGQTEQYPTILPWLKTEADCQGEGRNWRDNKCWDGSHDPMF